MMTLTQMGRAADWRMLGLVAVLGASAPAGAQTSWSLRNSGALETLNAVSHGTYGFVAAGEFGTVIASADGNSWAEVTLPESLQEMSYRALLHDGTRYVMSGQSGKIATSVTGTSWTASTVTQQATNIILTGLARGNGTYIACGSAGRIFRTTDPAVWTANPVVLAGQPLLQSAAFANGTFVVVGAGGYVARSTDGTAWTPVATGTGSSLSAAAFGNGTWVFVGSAGTIVSTADFATFTPRTSGVTDYLFGVTYAGGSFVAVGAGGVILTSTDGVGWTRRDTALTERIASVAEGDGTFVAVGEPTSGTGSAAVLTAAGSVSAGVKWSASAATVAETSPSLTLTIQRTGPTTTPAQVRYVLRSGTATVGTDLPDSGALVTFAPGETSKTIVIPITNDTLVEGAERFTVELRIESGGLALLLPSTVEVTITDDEDTDSDGLADAWEQQYFSNLAATAAGDPDGDGNSNLTEQADGTDPTSAASVLYSLNIVTVGNGQVNRSPAPTKYAKGTAVTLAASPAAGWSFKNWSGAAAGATDQTSLSMTANATVTATFALVVPAAIDAESRPWTLSGTGAAWFGQAPVNHDGVDAAQAGTCLAGQTTSFSTVVDGPAKVTFWWKCSCNGTGDALRFTMDGAVQTFISGEQDWVSHTYNMPSGRHTLAWTFARGGGAPGGQDTAWVDTIRIEDELGQWLAKWFTDAEISDPTVSGLDADPDGDGLKNRLEFALDLNPKASSLGSAALPRAQLVTVSGVKRLALVYQRPATRTGRLVYSLQTSPALQAWSDAAATEEILSETAGVQTVRLVDPGTDTGVRMKYARLKVVDK